MAIHLVGVSNDNRKMKNHGAHTSLSTVFLHLLLSLGLQSSSQPAATTMLLIKT
eukprot:c3819_g1_i1 orf=91-252(-)